MKRIKKPNWQVSFPVELTWRAASILIVGILLVLLHYGLPYILDDVLKKYDHTLQDLLLLFVGFPMSIIALALTARRSDAAWQQAQVAIKQSETSERGLLSDRYQKGAEMLGAEKITTRMGGIYALGILAREHPEEYHAQIMDLLCAIIRDPVYRERPESPEKTGILVGMQFHCSPDIEAAARTIGKCRTLLSADKQSVVESGFTPDITRAYLVNANLEFANFQDAQLFLATLRQIRFKYANLTNADFLFADLTAADLTGANLENANMRMANLGNAKLADTKGLTQEMLISLKPSMPPASLPDSLDWPFEKGDDGEWHLK